MGSGLSVARMGVRRSPGPAALFLKSVSRLAAAMLIVVAAGTAWAASPTLTQPQLNPNPQLFCPPPNEIWNGRCVPRCIGGMVHTGDGQCVPCPQGMERWKDACAPACAKGQVRAADGRCLSCRPGTEKWFNICVPVCPPGERHVLPAGECKPNVVPVPPSVNPNILRNPSGTIELNPQPEPP